MSINISVPAPEQRKYSVSAAITLVSLKRFALLVLLGIAAAKSVWSAPPPPAYPPQLLEGARIEIYKKIDDLDLQLYIFEPAAGPKIKRAAIVFFFGAGSSPDQFAPHCRHLAALGMVAIAADLRVSWRHQVTVATSLADSKSLMRWLRANAAALGIDEQRIAAGGGSFGGFLAAATAVVPGFDDPADDARISAIPNALVLFNPALVLAPLDDVDLGSARTLDRQVWGNEPLALSPAHQVTPGNPPTIIFQGTADSAVPFSAAEAFTRLMHGAGNRCELVAFEGEPHGFSNYWREGTRIKEVLAGMDRFMVSLGYLKP